MDLIKKADDLYVPEDFEKYHYYFSDAEGKKKYTGVTTILNVLSKPALVPWAARMAVEYLQEHGEILPDDDREDMEWFHCNNSFLEQAKTAYAKKRDDGAKKGTDTHALVEEYVNDCIKDCEGHPALLTKENPIAVFADWAIKENITFLSAEKVLYSQKHWIAGTADLVFEKDGKTYIGDIKTYKKIWDRTPFYQCAGYAMMYEEMYGHKAHLKQLTETDDPLNYQGHEAQKIHGYCIINLPKEREFIESADVLWSFDTNGDTKAFMACLEIYRQNAQFVSPKVPYSTKKK